MKKNDRTQKKTTNNKHTTEDIEKQTHDEWIEKTKVKARAMLAEVINQLEAERARRLATFGRWAPVVEALEEVVRTTSEIAEAAVQDQPCQLATVERVRDAALALLGIDVPLTATPADVTDTALLLAQLANDDLDPDLADLIETFTTTLAAARVADLRGAVCSRW